MARIRHGKVVRVMTLHFPLEAIAKLRKELDAAEAAWLKEVAAYDRSYDWQAEGFMNPASALRHACHMSQGVARGHLELARKLEELPEVAVAFADGEISARHAGAIAALLGGARTQRRTSCGWTSTAVRPASRTVCART